MRNGAAAIEKTRCSENKRSAANAPQPPDARRAAAYPRWQTIFENHPPEARLVASRYQKRIDSPSERFERR
jgi:hypothetical protein